MKNSRKFIVLITLLAFSLTLFAGCGQQAGKDDPKQQVELVWYITCDDPNPDTPKVLEEVNKYLKDKINASLKIVIIPTGDYDKKITTIQSAGDTCDLVFTCSWINTYNVNAARGFFAPLDDLLKEYGQDVQKAIPEYLWQASYVNGKIYAVPSLKDCAFQQVFHVNKNFADKYNFDATKSVGFNGIFPLYEKFKKDNPKGVAINTWPKALPLDVYDTLVDFKFPGAVRFDNGKVVNQWEDKEWIDWLKQYREMYVKGYLHPDANVPNGDPTRGMWDNGKMCSYVGVNAPYIDTMLSTAQMKKPNGFQIVSARVWDKPVLTTSGCTGSMIAISATSKHPERAMKFINLLHTDSKLANMIAYGIEGVHYKKTGENHIVFLPAHQQYSMPAFTMGMNMFITYVTEDNPDDMWKKYAEYNDSGVKSPALGFVFNPEPVKNEMSAIRNLADEFGNPLFAGAEDVEKTLKTFNAKMRDAGMDKVIAEMQKQYDEWKKTKK